MVLIYIRLLSKALYSVDRHSPVHAHVPHSPVHAHTDAGRQPAQVSRLDTTTLSLEEPGIEPATLRLPANPLYLS